MGEGREKRAVMRLLFRNRWIALLWATSVMASMAAFVSEDGGTAQVQAAAEQIRAQKSGAPAGTQAGVPDVGGGFTPDDELIADTAPESPVEPQVQLVASSREPEGE